MKHPVYSIRQLRLALKKGIITKTQVYNYCVLTICFLAEKYGTKQLKKRGWPYYKLADELS